MSLREINIDNIPKEYKIELLKNSREPVCLINDYIIESIKVSWDDIWEFNLKIPLYVYDEINMCQIKNPIYDLIDEHMLLQINEEDVFTITKIVDDENENYKTIEALSLEIKLNKLPITVTEKTRCLVKDNINIAEGILDLVTKDISWKIEKVEDKAKLDENGSFKYRWFDEGESFVLKFLKEDVSNAFDVLINFNTKKKTLSVYNRKTYGKKLPLSLSKDNFINNIQKSVDGTKIVTRLRARGKDNIVFNQINPLGTDYIEDVSFYRNEKYMSKDLLESLNRYDVLINYLYKQWSSLRKDLTSKQKDYEKIDMEIIKLNTRLKDYKEMQAGLIKEQSTQVKENSIIITKLSNLSVDIQAIEEKLLKEKNKQEQLLKEIEQINEKNNNISLLLNKKNAKDDKGFIFNERLLSEYEEFIVTENYSNENCLNAEDLLKETQRVLKEKSFPSIDFEINVSDFIKSMAYVDESKPLISIKLGDFIEVYSKALKEKRWVRLIGYTYSPNSNKLDLHFSSKDKINEKGGLASALEGIHKTTQKVDINKYYWNLSKENDEWIKNFRENSLDLVSQQIKSESTRNKINISELGIYLSDSKNENEQLAITNNIIAMTLDNWKTTQIAITPRWINGRLICAESINAESLCIDVKKKLEKGQEAINKAEELSTKFNVEIGKITAEVKSKTSTEEMWSKILLSPEHIVSAIKKKTSAFDEIYSTIEQTARSIKITMQDEMGKLHSEFITKADKILAYVEKEAGKITASFEITPDMVKQQVKNEINKSMAELKITSDRIETTVNSQDREISRFIQTAKEIKLSVLEAEKKLQSQINVTQNSIESKVSKGDFSTLMKQNSDTFSFMWNNLSSWIEMNDGCIIIKQIDGSYFKLGWNGITKFNGSTGKQVHYLTCVGTSDSNGWKGYPNRIYLPDEFKGKEFAVSLSVRDTLNSEKYVKTDYLSKIYLKLTGCNYNEGWFEYEGWWLAVSKKDGTTDDKELGISYTVIA